MELTLEQARQMTRIENGDLVSMITSANRIATRDVVHVVMRGAEYIQGDITNCESEPNNKFKSNQKVRLTDGTILTTYYDKPAVVVESNPEELRTRWEAIVNHPGWDGTDDIDLLIEQHNIDDAEGERDEYEQDNE